MTVTEKGGSNEESYIVALCDDAASLNYSEMMFGDSCTVLGSGSDGGASEFQWEAPAVDTPEEEEEEEAGEVAEE